MDDTLRSVLVCLGLLLIAAGAGLALCFGYVAYQTLFAPEKVALITYLMQKVATTSDVPLFTANMDGRVATYHISDSLKIYGLVLLFLAGFRVLIATARCMTDTGVHIIKVLWPTEAPPKSPTV